MFPLQAVEILLCGWRDQLAGKREMSTRANEGRRLDLRLPKHDNYCVKSPLAADCIHLEFSNTSVWTVATFVNQD